MMAQSHGEAHLHVYFMYIIILVMSTLFFASDVHTIPNVIWLQLITKDDPCIGHNLISDCNAIVYQRAF